MKSDVSKIVKARGADIGVVMSLLDSGRALMRSAGNPRQWPDGYPRREVVEADIAAGNSWLCLDAQGRAVATFAFILGDDPTYRTISGGRWLDDSRPYGVVHRMAKVPGVGRVFERVMDFCLARVLNLRVDTHRDNVPMQRCLQRNGFAYCGVIRVDDGSERLAYQRVAAYNDYGSWIRRQFSFRVQKIAVDAGFSCPNRDGTIATGGCVFCDNRTFNPRYCDPHHSVTRQLEEGKAFFSRKYPDMKYLAYFQAFTNTHAPLDTLKRLYEEALAVDDVVGLVIGTRPDCVPDSVLDYIAGLSRHTSVTVEYGIESANDATLRLINRGHTFACARDAAERTAARGINVGAHVILGLPGEDAAESLRQAPLISELPIDVLKIHQMQVVAGTRLAEWYAGGKFPLYTVGDYIALVSRYIARLRPGLVVERFVSQSPAEMLVAPHWGLKNHEFTNLLNNELKRSGCYQGSLFADLRND